MNYPIDYPLHSTKLEVLNRANDLKRYCKSFDDEQTTTKYVNEINHILAHFEISNNYDSVSEHLHYTELAINERMQLNIY